MGNKSFNLKIKLTSNNSFKKLKLSTQKKQGLGGIANATSIIRSSTKDDCLNRSNLSAPRNAYNSNTKIDNSGIETSHIIDEKMSDMSFSYNLNEIIGSMDDKTELKRMKNELNEKD